MKPVIGLLTVLTLLTGCQSERIQGGSVTHASPTGSFTRLEQSQDPKAPSTIDNSSERTTTFTLPAGSRINVTGGSPANPRTPGAAPAGGESFQAVLSSNTPVTITVKDDLKTSSGAAQKNAIGEMIAKLDSMRWIQWVGVALFVFGIASIAWPPLRLIIGSVTTSAWIIAGGLALMILPVLIVGNELLILCGVAAAVGIWFLAHRHGVMSAVAQGLEPGKLTPATPAPGKTPPAAGAAAPAPVPATPAPAASSSVTAQATSAPGQTSSVAIQSTPAAG